MMQFNPMYINVNDNTANMQLANSPKLKGKKYLFADIIKVLMGNQDVPVDNLIDATGQSPKLDVKEIKLLEIIKKEYPENAVNTAMPLISLLPDSVISKLESGLKHSADNKSNVIQSEIPLTFKELKDIAGKNLKLKIIKTVLKQGGNILVNLEDEDNQVNVKIFENTGAKKNKFTANISVIKNKNEVIGKTENYENEIPEAKDNVTKENKVKTIINKIQSKQQNGTKNAGKKIEALRKSEITVKKFIEENPIRLFKQNSNAKVDKGTVQVVLHSGNQEKAKVVEFSSKTPVKQVRAFLNEIKDDSQLKAIKKIEITNNQNKPKEFVISTKGNGQEAKKYDSQKIFESKLAEPEKPVNNKEKIENPKAETAKIQLSNGEKINGKNLFAKEYFNVTGKTIIREKPLLNHKQVTKSVENKAGTQTLNYDEAIKHTGKKITVVSPTEKNPVSSENTEKIAKPELRKNNNTETNYDKVQKDISENKSVEKNEVTVEFKSGKTENRVKTNVDKPSAQAAEKTKENVKNSKIQKPEKNESQQILSGKEVKQTQENIVSKTTTTKQSSAKVPDFEREIIKSENQKHEELSTEHKPPKSKVHNGNKQVTKQKHIKNNTSKKVAENIINTDDRENKGDDVKNTGAKVRNSKPAKVNVFNAAQENVAKPEKETTGKADVNKEVNVNHIPETKEHLKPETSDQPKNVKENNVKESQTVSAKNDSGTKDNSAQSENQSKSEHHPKEPVKHVNNKTAFEHVSEKITDKNMNATQQTVKSEPVLRSVKYTELFREISKFIQKNEKTTMVLELEPKHLGKVNISLDSSNNSIKAHIQVDNLHAKQLLEKNLDELFSNLNKDGIQLGSLNISMNNAGKQQSDHKTGKKGTKFNVEEIENEIQDTVNTRYYGYNTYEYLA